MWLFKPELTMCHSLVDTGDWIWASKWRFQICEQSYTANMTDTLRESLCHECEMEDLIPPQSGQTLEHSTGDRGVDAWILSLAASRVKTLAPQIPKEEALPAEKRVDCGIGSETLFATLDRDSCSWKTPQNSLIKELTLCSPSFPKSGSMLSGNLYRRARSVPRKSVKEFSSWPTPIARDASRGRSPKGDDIITQIHNWATPCAADSVGSHGGGQGSSFRTDMHNLKHSGVTDELLKSVIGEGWLNPEFLAWLMGLPIAWTELDVMASAWFLRKPRSRGKSSRKELR